jgi:hypothetical protein
MIAWIACQETQAEIRKIRPPILVWQFCDLGLVVWDLILKQSAKDQDSRSLNLIVGH